MEDKELLSAWEKIGELYGPQKRTFDEFKFQMQSNDYRKETFKKLGDNAKDVWGYDNFDQFNADKFLPAPALEINDVPTTANNLPRYNAGSSTFVDQKVEVARGSNPKLAGGGRGRTLGSGGGSRRISPRTQELIDANNSKKEKAIRDKKLERAKIAAATTSDLVTQNADFYDVVSNYSSVSGENALESQLSYNNGELDGVEKGEFEQKAMNFIANDMFAVVDDTENSQVWKDHGGEYSFLINQLNAQTKEIRKFQDQLSVTKDPAQKQVIINGINDLMDEGAEFEMGDDTDKKQYRYGSYNDMQERFGQLNSLPEFKNYQRAVNVLGHIRDVSDDFENRNPEWVENQKGLKGVQSYLDLEEKYDLPTANIGGYQPKWFKNGITKPILGSLAKAAREIAALPRTFSFNDDYGWTDALAEGADRILNPEKSQVTKFMVGKASNIDRGLSERVAMVDDYQLVLSDNIGEEARTPKNVRDKDGFLIEDPKVVQEIIEKYEQSPEEYPSEQQYNYGSILPKFTGVMADLGILLVGTKGLGTVTKGTGKVLAKTGLKKTGNFLSKSNVANRIGLTGAVTGQTHNGLYEEAIRQGMSPTEASTFALTGSLTVAAIAQFNPQFYLLGEKQAATKLTQRYIQFLAQGGKESKKTAFKYAMREVLGQGKREMFEELAEIPALNLNRKVFNEFTTPDKEFEINWSRGEIEESAIFGLAAGLATGPMSITSQSALQQQATYAAYKAKDKFYKRTNDLVGKQYMDPESGDMLYYTQEQADASKEKFSSLFKQLDAAKGSTGKLDEETETRLLSLFQQANAVSNVMDYNENPALTEVLDAQYALINDAIGEILQKNRTPIEPKKPSSDGKPKPPPSDGTGAAPVATEQEVSIDNEIDSELNNDSENVLDGRVKPEVKPELEVNENTTEEELEDIANEGSKEGRKQQAKNIETKVEGDQNVESEPNPETKVYDENIVPGHFTMLYNDAFGIKVNGPKDKNGNKDLDKVVNKAMKESKTYQEALGKLKKLNPKGETKQDSKPKPLFTKDEVSTAKATGDYLTPLIERLKQNFPGVEVVVDAKLIEELALSQNVSPEGAKQARGVFDVTNNRIVINPNTANKDTPIHEFGHVWTRLAKEERKELWDKGMSLIADSDIVKRLREQIAQNPDLQKVYTEDKILDEALAIAIGQRGAKIFESQEQQGIWDNWIKEFFDFIKNKFNVKSEGDIENLTLREFIELASTEILTGEKVVPVSSRVKLDKIKGKYEIVHNESGLMTIINPKTGKEVSRPTRKKIEEQIIAMEELPVGYIDAALELKQVLEEDAQDRGQFYDPVEAEFTGYKIKRQSFIDNSDVSNITNTLARGWFAPDGMAIDEALMNLESDLYGDYNANSPKITEQDLIDIMLGNPGNTLRVPEQVYDAKEKFLEETGMNPSLRNAQLISQKQTDELAKLEPTRDNDTEDLPFELAFQADFVDSVTGISFSYDKNTDKFRAMEDTGYITKDKSLRDFADKKMILHTPDFAFSGQISSDGQLIVEGKGGMYYPIKFHQDGYFWASTKDGAASMVKSLNKSLKANGGKIYMGLVTAQPTKLLSSVTASNGVVDLFMSPAFSKKLGITQGQLNRSLVNAANDSETITKNGKTTVNGLRAGVKARAKSEDTLKLIRTKLAADQSTFDDRKFFVQSFLDRIAKNINKSSTSKRTQKKLLKFFKSSVGFEGMKTTGTKLSKANLSDAVSYMLGEPLLRSESETNKIYAVLEIDGQVEDVDSNAHESYPKAIKSKDGSKTRLHILKDRADWRDNVADPDTDTNIKEGEPRKKDGKPRSFKQILPTTAGMTYNPVRVLSENENPGMSFQLDNGTNKKQVAESIQRLKKQGKFTESQLVDYFNRRFPDVSKKELGEMWNGKIPEENNAPKKRKYTSRLEQVLSEETYEAISEEAKNYIPKRNSITDAEADAMLESVGLEESIKIIKSNPEWLLPEVRIALTNKVVKALEAEAQKLREQGKDTEANVISTAINGIVEIIAQEGTKAGRFIQAFKLLDALSVDRTVALINKKLDDAGKPPLTKEQEAEVRRLKEESDNAPEGLPKSNALAAQYKYTQGLVGGNFKSIFEAYFYASILSGMTTQIRNIMANVMSINNELIITSIREAFLGNPKAIFNATEGLIKGLSKGWLNAKHILETGVKSDRSDKFDAPVLLEWWRVNTNSKVLNKFLNYKFTPWSPNFLKYVQRAMVAGDQLFYHSAKEMQSYALASRIKNGKNVTPEDLKKAEEILSPPADSINKAEEQARKEGFEEGSTQFKIRVHELMEGYRDMTIQGTSEEFASKTTFNYEPEGALSYMYNAIVSARQFQGVGPIVTTFIPFARVLTNVFNRFLHYTPVGAITAARGKVRVASGKTRVLSSEEKADLYIKSSIGMSTLTGLVAYLMSQADDDDAFLKISAAGPSDFNKKYELQKGGWKPFHITIGDVSFSYADHPLYFILAGAGTLYESDKYGNSIDGEGNADLFSYVALTTAMSMLQQSWLQGLSDLGRILNSRDPAKAVANKVFGVASSIALPNFHKQLVRQSMQIMGDPIKARRTGTLTGALDQLYRDIPLANNGLYDMVDNYGDPVIPGQAQKFVPLDVEIGEKGDPLAKHLVSQGVYVGSASNRKIEDFETRESRYLTGDEYQVYKMESAKAVGKALRRDSRYLKELKGEYLAEAVRGIKLEARDQALYKLFYYGEYKKITKKK